ncbi:MAG: elongation factor Ts [Ruminococcaceae bacterium]|nr:elongation factor Ts [Oscillospiraceae bacterium]
MAFTAKDVQTLRERTGVGMMECKKALSETDGDMEKAIDVLREKGLAKAAKKAGRIAAEGVAYATTFEDKKVGVVVEVNSETDFVAKNPQFQEFVAAIADTIAETNPADMDDLMTKPCAGAESVTAALQEKILVIGENMTVRRFVRYEGDCVAYVHGGGRIGVLVRFETDGAVANDALTACGKDVAMQIAALNPLYLSKEAVPAADVEKEREVQIALIKADPKNANKPEQIVEKMVEGKLRKFFEENCLLQQAFVKDGDLSVGQYIENCAKAAGGSLKLVEYTRFEKGEGLQKREDDFAAEVASMMG